MNARLSRWGRERPQTPRAEARWRTVLLWILRLGLGGLFVLTGVLKLGDPSKFAIEIHNYQLFPQLAPLLAATLPVVEIVVGAAILAGPRAWVRAGALASGALMVVFTIAVSSALTRGVNISCGCFGAGSGTITLLTVLRDLALLAACAAVFVLAEPTPEPSPEPAPAA